MNAIKIEDRLNDESRKVKWVDLPEAGRPFRGDHCNDLSRKW